MLFYCSLFYCAMQMLHCFCLFVCFYKLKVCSNPSSSKSISIIFPTFALFVCVSGFSNSCNISNYSLLYLLWWPSSSGLWYTVIIVWGYHKICPYGKLITVVCVLTALLICHFPFLFFSSDLPIPWDSTILKLGQLITPRWPLSVQRKWRVACLSLQIKS